jgi:hypothetical protein
MEESGNKKNAHRLKETHTSLHKDVLKNAVIAFYNGSDDDDDEKTVPNGTLTNPRGSLPYSYGGPSYVGSPFSGHKSTGVNEDAWLPWDDSLEAAAERNKQIKQDFCNHEWKQYTGLNETFRYCTRCDKKQS